MIWNSLPADLRSISDNADLKNSWKLISFNWLLTSSSYLFTNFLRFTTLPFYLDLVLLYMTDLNSIYGLIQ